MAKAMVKCLVCGEYFDRNSEPFIQEGRRYLHASCAEKRIQIEKDKEDLYNYIKALFNVDSVPLKAEQQIKKMMKENKNYTYSGIFKSLYYFYDVKGNSLDRANGGIGIVPFVYEEAREYYYRIWQANQKNQVKILEQYRPQQIVIQIESPKKETRKKKQFSFLDKEELGDEE
jgi:hypothetical protein